MPTQQPHPPHDPTVPHVRDLAYLSDRHRHPLAVLKLAAYAADAMRVLHALELHAKVSPALSQAIFSACPDWRNPGATHDPADLIAVVLAQLVEDMEGFASVVSATVESLQDVARQANRSASG